MSTVADPQPPVSKPPRRLGRRFLRILGIFALVIAALAVIGAIYQTVSASADRRNHPPVGKFINVGDHSLHWYCTGQGSPTVVLIAGAGNMYAHWDAVQTRVSEFTRVCSYDRAGTGWSDHPSKQPTMETHLEDLHTLLQNSGETGPFILVGHSMGGIQARMYYNRYPNDVAGMVLVDSSVEGMYQHLPGFIEDSNRSAGAIWNVCQALAPVGLVRLAGLGNSYANAFPDYSDKAKAAITATFNRTENCRGMSWETALESFLETGAPAALDSLPLIVLTRGLDEVQANPGQRFSEKQAEQFRQAQADWLKLQAQLVGLSTNSRQVIADQSGHFIQNDQPDLVVSAIRDMITNFAH